MEVRFHPIQFARSVMNVTIESEFWLAMGKTVLIIGLICFTFITMVGGNPHRDAYGFRYWKCEFLKLSTYNQT